MISTADRPAIHERANHADPYDRLVETVYRTEARPVSRSVLASDDGRATLHTQLLAEATVGIARTYGDDTTPNGPGVVQVLEELPDGRLSIMLTVAIRRHTRS